VLLAESNMGPNSLLTVPIAGGEPSTIEIHLNLFGLNAIAADANNIYVVGSGCNCSNGGDKTSRLPEGGVGRIRLDGSESEMLARFTGQASSIAVDSDYVYWSTDKAVWKTSIAGGDAVQLAGGLSIGTPPYQCSGCSGPGYSQSMPIAVDATSVYVSDSVAEAVLKIAK
jgi:hypothetical protein